MKGQVLVQIVKLAEAKHQDQGAEVHLQQIITIQERGQPVEKERSIHLKNPQLQ